MLTILIAVLLILWLVGALGGVPQVSGNAVHVLLFIIILLVLLRLAGLF